MWSLLQVLQRREDALPLNGQSSVLVVEITQKRGDGRTKMRADRNVDEMLHEELVAASINCGLLETLALTSPM